MRLAEVPTLSVHTLGISCQKTNIEGRRYVDITTKMGRKYFQGNRTTISKLVNVVDVGRAVEKNDKRGHFAGGKVEDFTFGRRRRKSELVRARSGNFFLSTYMAVRRGWSKPVWNFSATIRNFDSSFANSCPVFASGIPLFIPLSV